MTVRLGLIGAGEWGVKIIRALRDIPNARLDVVSTHRAVEVRPLLPPDTVIAPSAGAILDEHSDLDAIIVASPASTHARILRDIWDAPIPVFVEKPLCMNLVDAKELGLLWGEAGKPLVLVDHVQLFNPAVVSMRDILKKHGGPVNLTGLHAGLGPFRSDCSALWDYGAHDAAIALWLFDATVGTVSASGQTYLAGTHFMETATLKFESRTAKAALTVSNEGPTKFRQYRAMAMDGSSVLFDDLADEKVRLSEFPIQEVIPVPSTPPLTAAVEAFVRAVANGRAPAGDTRFGLELPLWVICLLHEADECLHASGVMRPQKQPPTL